MPLLCFCAPDADSADDLHDDPKVRNFPSGLHTLAGLAAHLLSHVCPILRPISSFSCLQKCVARDCAAMPLFASDSSSSSAPQTKCKAASIVCLVVPLRNFCLPLGLQLDMSVLNERFIALSTCLCSIQAKPARGNSLKAVGITAASSGQVRQALGLHDCLITNASRHALLWLRCRPGLHGQHPRTVHLRTMSRYAHLAGRPSECQVTSSPVLQRWLGIACLAVHSCTCAGVHAQQSITR